MEVQGDPLMYLLSWLKLLLLGTSSWRLYMVIGPCIVLSWYALWHITHLMAVPPHGEERGEEEIHLDPSF